MIPVVETHYVCRIDYEVTEDYSAATSRYDRIASFANEVARKADLHLSFTSGGPAWNAYLVITGSDKESVSKAAAAIVAYIMRFKGAKFYE